MGDPRGTDPNLDGVSSISETPSNTTAMRGWGCTWLSLLPDAIIYGSGSGPRQESKEKHKIIGHTKEKLDMSA